VKIEGWLLCYHVAGVVSEYVGTSGNFVAHSAYKGTGTTPDIECGVIALRTITLIEQTMLELVSVHIPKTAGTALYAGLVKHYGQALLADHNVTRHKDWVKQPKYNTTCPAPVEPSTRAVHGHFRADRYDGSDAIMMTWLRDPVERLLSNYFYHLAGPSAVQFDRADLRVWANRTADYYATLLCCIDSRRFNFVGFTDRWGDDLARMERVIGIKIEPAHRVNETPANPQRKDVEADTALVAELRDILRPDYAVYDGFREAWT
jgi:hypothetical protein